MFRAACSFALICCAPTFVFAGDWPQWRGPTGVGQASNETAPLEWSTEKNVVWKTELPAPGNSTPIIVAGKVFITQASADGKDRSLICFDQGDGKEIWRDTVRYNKEETTHDTNPQAAGSPTTDGKVVVTWYGSAGVHAYDLEGKKLWSRDLGEFAHIWGYGSSPVMYEDLVILNCGPGTRSFVVALNKNSGEEVWRRNIPELVAEKPDQFLGSWSTPVLVPGEPAVMLLSAPKQLFALDPATGKDIWQCGGLSNLQYTSPITDGKIAVAMSGYSGAALAVRLGGQGDVTDTHRLWLHNDKKIPQRVGSGVIVGDYVYIYNATGIAWCIELKSGEIKWQERLGGVGWTSMVHIGERLYVINTSGRTYVLEPNPEKCVVVAQNDLGNETTRASIAVADGQLFIRTYNHLYCIGAK